MKLASCHVWRTDRRVVFGTHLGLGSFNLPKMIFKQGKSFSSHQRGSGTLSDVFLSVGGTVCTVAFVKRGLMLRDTDDELFS